MERRVFVHSRPIRGWHRRAGRCVAPLQRTFCERFAGILSAVNCPPTPRRHCEKTAQRLLSWHKSSETGARGSSLWRTC